MATLYTGATTGVVHIVKESHRLTLCGRETETPSRSKMGTPTPWARWSLKQADLTTRQRPLCDTCRTTRLKY